MVTTGLAVSRRTALACLGLALASGVVGCGSRADVPRPAALRGRVTWRGKPLAGAMVYAVSESSPAAAPATAQTAKDGSYAMDKVPGGRVRIAVVPSEPASAPGAACDLKYADWRSSGLAVETAAGELAYDITLE